MPYDDENARESTEQQLRRELAELKEQLRAQREGHAGPPEIRWRPSGVTIASLVLGIVVLFALLFIAGYVPLQRRDATVRAEEAERKAAQAPE